MGPPSLVRRSMMLTRRPQHVSVAVRLREEVPMPLRDHFRPPVSLRATWDALHGMWPAAIVRQLRQRLPEGYVAAPTVHPGSQIEVAVATYERDDAPRLQRSDDQTGAPMSVWAPPEPTVA